MRILERTPSCQVQTNVSVGRNAGNARNAIIGSVLNQAQTLLQDVFGYPEFRGAQAEIIAQVVGGGDALVLMPTGGGKSLCYQLPALLRPGVGIVVSPLIALMQDQVDALRLLGVKAAFLKTQSYVPGGRERRA